jgi:hypothetical protein
VTFKEISYLLKEYFQLKDLPLIITGEYIAKCLVGTRTFMQKTVIISSLKSYGGCCKEARNTRICFS